MNAQHLARSLALGLLLLTTAPRAEDIDVFKAGGMADPDPPNVLIFLDNTSNWSSSSQQWSWWSSVLACNNDTVCLSFINDIFTNGFFSVLRQGQVELRALKLVLKELVCDAAQPLQINVGLMMIQPNKGTYTTNAGTGTDASGISGEIRRATVLLDKTTRCPVLLADLDRIDSKITDEEFKAASNANYGGAMYEAFKYFGGHTNPAGATANPDNPAAGSPTGHISFGPVRYGSDRSLQGSDTENTLIFADGATRQTYKSPIPNPPLACDSKNFLLLIGNTWPNGDTASLLTSNVGYSYSTAGFPFATGSQPRLGDVWARFLATTDVSPNAGQQTVLTSAINVYQASPNPDQTTLLKSMARQGAGNYYEVGGNLYDLINALRSFFVSLNAKNSNFTAATVTQSMATRSVYLNQVYLGLFRPAEVPRWYGNLKLYTLGLDPNSDLPPDAAPLVLMDKNNNPAVSAVTGFMSEMAESYWSHSSTFWNFRCGSANAFGDPTLCGNPKSPSDLPDGPVVEKGGAGQMLREAFTSPPNASNSSRNVYTCLACSSGTALSSVPFNTTTISPASAANQTAFGASAAYNNSINGSTGAAGEVTDIINWVRGVDNVGENTLINNRARPSMPGDNIHAQTVVVNYNTSASGCADTANLDKDLVAYYASNDAMLHAIKVGLTGTGAGLEQWAFVPQEFFGVLKRLHDNFPAVVYAAAVPAGDTTKPYTLDGNLSVYSPDLDFNCKPDKVWLYLTLRRGGRFVYALDVTSPANPKFLWKKSNLDTGYSELGQTWSEMTPFLRSDGLPLLIFGGGYDPAVEDRGFVAGSYQNPPSTTKTMGRAIFIVNAETGAIVKSFGPADGLTDSIPSGVALVSNLMTGVVRYAYVGDTGGNLWRVNFNNSFGQPSATASDWTLRKVAALGDSTDTSKTGANARKFLYPPNILPISGGGYSLFIGSGDREKPFETTVVNRFYRINDKPDANLTLSCTPGDQTSCTCTDSAGASTACTLYDATSANANTTVPGTASGWFMTLASGEKTVGSAVTDIDLTFFPTNRPTITECSLTPGEARMYTVYARNGGGEVIDGAEQAKYRTIATGGFPPSPKLVTVPITATVGGVTTVTNRTVVLAPTGFVRGRPTVPARHSVIYRYREGLD